MDLAEQLRLTTVASPEHLQQVLTSYFGEERVTDRRVLYRAYFWMAYAGLARRDAFRIKGSDLNLGEMVIEYNGRRYQIYPQAIEPLVTAATLRYITVPRKGTAAMEYKRCDGDELLRPRAQKRKEETVSAEESARAFKVGLSRYLRERPEDYDLTYATVSKSGFFYREYEREQAGYGEADFQEFIEQRRFIWEHTPDRRSDKYASATEIRRLTARMEVEYEVWKRIYHTQPK